MGLAHSWCLICAKMEIIQRKTRCGPSAHGAFDKITDFFFLGEGLYLDLQRHSSL